jgi:hypothetical protein
VIVFVLGLVIVVVIVSNVFLWNYEMNQLDWERMREDIEMLDVAPLASSSWFVAESEYSVNEGSLIGGNYTDTQEVEDSYETFMEGVIAQTLHLHRANISGVTPAGKLMNATLPSFNQSETEYKIGLGTSVYFYTPTLSTGSIENGTWTLHIWASTASGGNISRLTIQLHLVSSDGSTEKANIGTATDIIIDYGYSERTFLISGNATNVTSGDRIRLTLHAQTGSQNDPKGISFYYDGYGSHETLGHETRLQSPSSGSHRLDLNGNFSIDVSTYPLAYVHTVEIQMRYKTDDTSEKWYLKAYNWTAGAYGDSGFNSTAGHTPTIEWDYYTINLTDQWNSYVQNNGTIFVKIVDEKADTHQTTIEIDFLGVRAVINGTRLTFKNEAALTTRLVSLWIINTTFHKRYDIDLIINSAQTIIYTRADISLPSGQYTVKVITERGNTATYSGG